MEEVGKGHEAGGKALKAHLDGYNLVPSSRGEVKGPPREEFLHWGGDSDRLATRLNRWKISFKEHGPTVPGDAGPPAYRESDDALGLTGTAATWLHDARTGQDTRHSLPAPLRQSIYSRWAGYQDVNDAGRLGLGPAPRAVVIGCAKDTNAASTSEMARFETEALSTEQWAQGAAGRVAAAPAGGNRCHRPSAAVTSVAGFAAEAPRGLHRGNSG